LSIWTIKSHLVERRYALAVQVTSAKSVVPPLDAPAPLTAQKTIKLKQRSGAQSTATSVRGTPPRGFMRRAALLNERGS